MPLNRHPPSCGHGGASNSLATSRKSRLTMPGDRDGFVDIFRASTSPSTLADVTVLQRLAEAFSAFSPRKISFYHPAHLPLRAAGAVIVKPAGETFWGGYSGYFADPDGHPWEVAFNPFWKLDENGRVVLPE